MLGVVDYKAGNSTSVLNALNKIGCNGALVKSKDEISKCSGIILPGVGSADATMQSLRDLDLVDFLTDLVMERKKPFLGICVGLQVLFKSSEEGNSGCLGWLPGRVVRFDDNAIRVPQMGWNRVDFKRDSLLLNGIKEGYFYFVNSYYAIPEDENIILGTTEYGVEFCSVVEYKNIWAAQCHLEKSGEIGLKIFENFAALTGSLK
ncbi:MAG: imidazole glycerol phosphate synthase subunit HisH [Eubacteriales bacterium]